MNVLSAADAGSPCTFGNHACGFAAKGKGAYHPWNKCEAQSLMQMLPQGSAAAAAGRHLRSHIGHIL